VKDERGRKLDHVYIHLVDFSEELGEDEGCELQLAGMHWRIFDSYFPGGREASEDYYRQRLRELRNTEDA